MPRTEQTAGRRTARAHEKHVLSCDASRPSFLGVKRSPVRLRTAESSSQHCETVATRQPGVPPPDQVSLCRLVDDLLDPAAVEVEFAGYGALAVALLVQRPYRLL